MNEKELATKIWKEKYQEMVLECQQLREEIKKLHQRDTYTDIVHNQFQLGKKKRYYENILDELEKWLEEEIRRIEEYGVSFGLTIDEQISEYITDKISGYKNVLKKIKELKGE